MIEWDQTKTNASSLVYIRVGSLIVELEDTETSVLVV